MKNYFLLLLSLTACSILFGQESSWIRINQLGYTPGGIKVAVWCSKQRESIDNFELVDADSKKAVFQHTASRSFGAYGPFEATARLDFSGFRKPGKYFIRAGLAVSPVFRIDAAVYQGAADFCLRYMRQQRSGFNPFLQDSCHTHDGYTLYGPMPDSTHIDVVGGWHDASDYLQYSTTSANATYHLLAAYRDFPSVFRDEKQANGLDGENGMVDVLDEAKWGLDWLLKMNPQHNLMFNQLGDDRDHMGMRIPKEDSFYGKGFERPVYFLNGKPQQRGKFLNATTGVASTAGKFASAFALGSMLFQKNQPAYAKMLGTKAGEAFSFGVAKPGVAQTASVRSPYIYAEGDWIDDMELAAAQLFAANGNSIYRQSFNDYLGKDAVGKWMGKDTAAHYQYYPFNNLGVYAMAHNYRSQGKMQDAKNIIANYREGLQKVQEKANRNAFRRGIPFIWCSNNLTVSFAIQCYWYRQISGKTDFAELEQANFDWIFGCNPWGTSMVYGLPADGDTPVDPHSAFTHLKNYPIDGGLVDGPVYTSIYKGLIGIHLQDADEYDAFQSGLAVYHDDYGDYSTNEPTMDGTASLIYLLAAKEAESHQNITMPATEISHGAVIRGDSAKKQIALVFTGDEFGDGLPVITNTLEKQHIKASFFFTGRFYRTKTFQPLIKKLYAGGHILGPHSDQHLLYCDWTKRDSLLVTKDSLFADLTANKKAMEALGIDTKGKRSYFIPPYEWWNDSVASWMDAAGIRLFCFTPGTRSNADYTYPEMGKSYLGSDQIIRSIQQYAETRPAGLNGVILLVHAGTDPRRKDKLYNRLDELIGYLKQKGYAFRTIADLLR
jgi:peptidoglycan/xylan/chitin deacetylase (PgdA/CDA1 family)